MSDEQSFLSGAKDLLQATAEHLQKNFPQLSPLICDHICYRVSTLERYNDLKNFLQTFADLTNESLVNGRTICIFQLKQAIHFAGISTDCIELPAPKTGSPHAEGWEHAEMVVNLSLAQFMQYYPHVSFDTVAMNKKINPEISVTTDQGYRIKFHEQPILEVIKLEQKLLSEPNFL